MRPDSPRGEAAQMLLLTAIILAIGFIALASMAARIDQIPDQADTLRQDAVFEEVGLVADAVSTAMDGLAVDPSTDNTTFEPDLQSALAHLKIVEAGRGYYVSIGTIVCDDSGGFPEVTVPVALANTRDEVAFTITGEYPGKDLCL